MNKPNHVIGRHGRAAILGAILAVNISIAEAGRKEHEADAFSGCTKAFAKRVDAGNFFVVDRLYGMIRLKNGDFRYFLNGIDKRNEPSSRIHYRAECTSGGFARLRGIEVSTGKWVFDDKSGGIPQVVLSSF